MPDPEPSDSEITWDSSDYKSEDSIEELPFAHSNNETLVDFDIAASSTLKPLLERKDRTIQEFKDNNRAIFEVLTQDYKTREKNGTIPIEYDEAINVEGNNVKIYGLKTQDIVQIPFLEGRYWKTWKEYFNESEMAKLWPSYKNFKDSDYVTISMKKLHDLFPTTDGLNEKLTKLINYINREPKDKGQPYWKRVKNYPVVYIVQNNGVPKVRVPYEFTSSEHDGKKSVTYKTLKDFDFDDIVRIRKFKGNVNPDVKPSPNDIESLNRFINEVDPKSAVSYEDSVEFEDLDHKYIKNVEFQRKDGSGSFTQSYIQKKDGTQLGGIKGHFGTLNKLLKNLDNGTIVKFSNQKINNKHEMLYGKVIGNGASGLILIYKDGNDVKNKIVPYSKVTEVFLPSGTNQDIFSQLAESDYIKFNKTNRNVTLADRKLNFGRFMKGLYKNKGKDVTIYDFDYLKQKHPDDFMEFKTNILNKIKTGSVIKYVGIDSKGIVTDYVGTFFYTDGGYTYILDGYGEILKIANANEVKPYNKNTNSREFIRGVEIIENQNVPIKNNYAVDVAFSDMSREAQFVDYLKGIKLYIQSQYASEGSPESKPFDKLKEDLVNKKISEAEFIKLYEQLQITNAKSLNDVVDVVEFTKFDTNETNNKTIVTSDQIDLLNQQEKEIQVSQLRIGDLVQYYNINDNKQVYRNWMIVVDFDAETGLPIVAQEKSNRITTQIIKVENIKAVGLQLNPVTIGDMRIEGRPELVKKRDELLKNLAESKSGIMDLKTIQDALDNKFKNAKNSQISSDKMIYENGGVKYEIYPLAIEFEDDKPYFTKKGVASQKDFDLAKKHGLSQKYGVRKHIKRKGSDVWGDGWSLYEYQITSFDNFGAYGKSFDQVKNASKLGTIIEVTKVWKKNGNENPKKYTMMVEKISQNVIKGSVPYTVVNENGESEIRTFPMNIYRDGKVETIINGMYNGDSKKLNEVNTSENNPTEVPIAKKSELFKGFNKSRDSKKSIIKALETLKDTYGVNYTVFTNNEMGEFGNSIGVDLSNARGLAYNGEIYINLDKASVADALHELGHLIVPGLQSLNSKAWEIIKKKVKDHPAYSKVKDHYSNLNENDLVEEAFITIFGEYYRQEYLAPGEAKWMNDNQIEFDSLSSNTENVIKDLFSIKDVGNYSADELLKLSLNDIMTQFGNAMLEGSLNVYFKYSNIATANNMMQKLYQKLIDTGKLELKC